jgi:hypothetical protein
MGEVSERHAIALNFFQWSSSCENSNRDRVARNIKLPVANTDREWVDVMGSKRGIGPCKLARDWVQVALLIGAILPVISSDTQIQCEDGIRSQFAVVLSLLTVDPCHIPSFTLPLGQAQLQQRLQRTSTQTLEPAAQLTMRPRLPQHPHPHLTPSQCGTQPDSSTHIPLPCCTQRASSLRVSSLHSPSSCPSGMTFCVTCRTKFLVLVLHRKKTRLPSSVRSERAVTTRPSVHPSLAVYPVDEFSGGESLVSALLQDPFSPEAESERITKRWEGHDQNTRLDIECGRIVFTSRWF